MASYTISPIWGAGAQLFDNNGSPLVGGKVYTYYAGSTTPLTTYTDPTGTVANTNPIISNSAGRLTNEIWFPVSGSYKFVLKDANDVLLATYDNIPTTPQPPIVNDASSVAYQPGYEVTAGGFTVGATYLITSVGTTDFVAIGAAANITDIHFTATGIGSGTGTAEYTRYVQDKLRETQSVKDFGAVGDGVTDDTAAIQAAIDSGNTDIYFPEGVYIVSATINVADNVTLHGASKTTSCIKLLDAAANGTNIISIGQYCTIRNLWIRGNWNKTTAGLLGIGIYAKDVTAGYIHGTTLEDVQVNECKSTGIYIYEGAYTRFYNVLSDTHGLDAVHFEGLSAGSCTTTEINGMSIFSACPNGYGLRLKNCHSSKYTFISEQTKGVAFEGNHRSLKFDTCYFETPASGSQDYIFNTLSGGAFGITIENCFLGMAVQTSAIQGDSNYQYGLLLNNNNLTTKPYLDNNYKNWTIVNQGRIVRALGTNATIETNTTIVGNTAATNYQLYKYTLPGATLTNNGQSLRIKAFGKTAANTDGKNIFMYFGTTTILTTGPQAANNQDWEFDILITYVSSTEQRICVNGLFNNAVFVNVAATTELTYNDTIFKILTSAGANNNCLFYGAQIELLDNQSLSF